MIKQYIKNIRHNRLVKNILVVAGGTAGAQAIGMLFIPFITRIYGPEVYGVLGAFVALTGVVTTLSTLAYPVAIVLPKSDIVAKGLVKISLLIALTISFMLLVILWKAGNWIMPALGSENIISFMYFMPFYVFLSACQNISQQWLIRNQLFKSIASVSIIHSVLNYGALVVAGLYMPLAIMLVSIQTISVGMRVALQNYFIKKMPTRIFVDEQQVSLKDIAYEYRDFPIYRSPQMVINAASQSLPVLMLTAFFGLSAAGFYTLTRTALSLPSVLLGTSVQSVFYPHFNELVGAGNKVLPLLYKATLALVITSLGPFIVIMIFGPFLFGLVFGQEWVQAGEYAQWLSIWLFFGLINRPSVSSIPVFRMQKWFLGYELTSIILRMIAIYIGFVYLSDALFSVAIFSLTGAMLNILLITKVFVVAKNFDNHQVRS